MQTQTSRIIQIGKGIDHLLLGEHKEVVLKSLLKKKPLVFSYEEEIQGYEDSGYSTENILLFEIGFDEAYEFDRLTSYPIFKLYFKDNKLCYMIFSSYRIAPKYYQDFVLDNGVKFLDSKEIVQQKMGKYEEAEELANHDGIWKYHQKGLELIFDENELRTFHFFEPLK